MCQNSGLGNMVNPLTSLNYPFRIPTLLIISQRGAPGVKDEPQHQLMGRVTGDLLKTIGISWECFPVDSEKVDKALERAEEGMLATGMPYAFVMAKGSVADYPLRCRASQTTLETAAPMGSFRLPSSHRMVRQEAIRTIRGALDGNEAIVASTGHIGRELYALGHRENQLYVVGSLGCALGIGLGIHEGCRNRPVVVLDGDGAILMKMGTLATVGHYRPKQLLHIILDNEAHESTGGQATASSTADLAAVASGCGYARVWRVESREELAQRVREAKSTEGPNLIHAKVVLGSDPNLGRPDLAPVEVKKQFMHWLSS